MLHVAFGVPVSFLVPRSCDTTSCHVMSHTKVMASWIMHVCCSQCQWSLTFTCCCSHRFTHSVSEYEVCVWNLQNVINKCLHHVPFPPLSPFFFSSFATICPISHSGIHSHSLHHYFFWGFLFLSFFLSLLFLSCSTSSLTFLNS